MRVYDNKGRLTVDFKLHASKHAKGGADEVSLAASQITSERFGMARIPDGTSGYYLKAQGAGVDPVYAAVSAVPSGLIAMWHGLIANIPSGWVICDGNNGTPNLLARFVEGVATAGTNPGATGGAISKTTTGHYHSAVTQSGLYTSPGVYDRFVWKEGDESADYPTDTKTDSISDIRPPFYDVAFIMKT
jgi:hypothetical protein